MYVCMYVGVSCFCWVMVVVAVCDGGKERTKLLGALLLVSLSRSRGG